MGPVSPAPAPAPALVLALVLALTPLWAQEEFPDDDMDGFADFGEAPGLTVSGDPGLSPRMEVIGREEIEKRNAPDLAALLEETLDIGVTRYGAYGNQAGINIRGFDSSRVAVLIDGVPANSARSGGFDPGQIDLAGVERIEVTYGGSDTVYNVSGALGGVINIVTVKKQAPGLSLGGGISNTGYVPGEYNRNGGVEAARFEDLADTQGVNFFAGYGGDGVSWKINWFGTRAANHYLYRDYGGAARRKQNNGVLDTGLGVLSVWDLPRDASLRGGLNLYFADKQYPVTGVSEGFAAAGNFSLKADAGYDAPVIFRDDISTEASLSYSFNSARYGAGPEDFDHGFTVINRWGWYPAEKLTLRAGGDWRFIYVDAAVDTERAGNAGGLFITAEYSPVEKIRLTGSVKGVTDTGHSAAVPKLGWAWQVHDTFKLKNNFFRSFKFPDFDDLFYRSADGLYTGNPALGPEDGWGADLSGEWQPEEWFEASVSAYFQWTEDSIHWVKQGPRWSPENTGTGCFAGFDLRPALTLPVNTERGFKAVERIRLGASYQFQLSRLLDGGADFAGAPRIPYMPEHLIGASLDLQWKTGSLLVSAHYESSRYADTGNLMELDPYCLVNLTLNQRIGKRWTVFAAIRNALNQLYTSFAEYPMPGVSFTAGARFKIDPQ